MDCKEFNEKGYLFIYNELKKSEAEAFRRHLRHCEFCRESLDHVKIVLDQLDRLPEEAPDTVVRRHILEEARNAQIQIKTYPRQISWGRYLNRLKELFYRPRSLHWALPAAALLVLLTVFVDRFIQTSQNMKMISSDSEWQDHFFTEADWINGEIDRVESGELLIVTLNLEEENVDQTEESSISDYIDDLRSYFDEIESVYYNI